MGVTFDPAAMARWQKRKAQIAAYVKSGEMTPEQAKAALDLYSSVVIDEAKPKHLRIVK
jgi:polyhydroxyalkanoate synthesis regulator phasin